QAAATAAPVAFDPTVSPNVVTADGFIHLAGFTNGQAVSYVEPAPTTFNSIQVDTNGDQESNANIANGSPALTTVNNDSIYLGKHLDANGNLVAGSGYATGNKVTYATNGTAIGGLSNGATYYTFAVDADKIQLLPSYASLGSVSFNRIANANDTIV